MMAGDYGTVPTGDATINGDQDQLVRTGEWEIYILGAVKYGDTFGASYETIYCFQYQTNGLPFKGCGHIKPTVLR